MFDHVGFGVTNLAASKDFHLKALQPIGAALAHGARDNGAPGLRPIYHPDYYGAFVFDPDGHNVEVVCHKPQT